MKETAKSSREKLWAAMLEIGAGVDSIEGVDVPGDEDNTAGDGEESDDVFDTTAFILFL